MNSLTLMANSNFLDTLTNLWNSTGFVTGGSDVDIVLKVCMMLLACFFVYLAVVKKFEPNLLLAIAFGMFLINIPGAFEILYPVKNINSIVEASAQVALKDGALQELFNNGSYQELIAGISNAFNSNLGNTIPSNVMMQIKATFETAPETFASLQECVQYVQDVYINTAGSMVTPGLFDVLFKGVEWVIFPPLIFLGIGAMTDFGPLIANPKSLLLGAAAQIGIFATFLGALLMGDMFTPFQAASIAIIGGADGPTAIYVTAKLAPEMLGSISIAAYSYMALVPVIQPPIMKLLTTKKERKIRMEQSKP